MRRPILELVVAIIASTLIGFGLTRGLTDLGWETAVGLGLLMIALVRVVIPINREQSWIVVAVLAVAGVILILMPYFQA